MHVYATTLVIANLRDSNDHKVWLKFLKNNTDRFLRLAGIDTNHSGIFGPVCSSVANRRNVLAYQNIPTNYRLTLRITK